MGRCVATLRVTFCNASLNEAHFLRGHMKKKVLSIIISLLVLFHITVVFSACNFTETNHSKNYDSNVKTLSSIVDKSLAEQIIAAMEDIGVIDDCIELTVDNIYEVGVNEYEIYLPLIIHLHVQNTHFILSTYETTYVDSPITLYNSTNPYSKRVLTNKEINDLHYTQRQTIVHNTIAITPNEGIVLHNALGSSKIELTFLNRSNTDISYIYIVVTPYIGNNGYTYNNLSFTFLENLSIGKSITKSLTTSKWSNYNEYKITSAVIMFADGTTIGLDKFDCQFMSYNNPTENDTVIDNSDKSEQDNNNEIDSENKECQHIFNDKCVCDICGQPNHNIGVDNICTNCGQGEILFDNGYVYFGNYPQKLITDSVILKKLNGNNQSFSWLTKDNFNGINVYGKMYYVDIEYNRTKYRGVKLETCSPLQSYNGFVEETIYWFEYEKIKWRVLETNENSAFLISELILDAQIFQADNHNDFIDKNNWEYSMIRQWLNEEFYNIAFDELQKTYIKNTYLDNKNSGGIYRKSTTGLPVPTYDPNNEFALCQNNTYDKIFLLSSQDTYNSKYGFTDDSSSFARTYTDYTKIQGLSTYDSDISVGNWFLRSPSFETGYVALPCGEIGRWRGSPTNAIAGILPAVVIDLQSISTSGK